MLRIRRATPALLACLAVAWMVRCADAAWARAGPDDATRSTAGQGVSGASFRRVVAIGPNSAEIVCALGACDAIVGVSKFCLYPPEVTSKPRVGGLFDPDLERIAALRPDLLLMRGRSDSLETLCEKLGVRIYYDEADSFAGIEKTVRDLGALLGRNAAASKVIETLRTDLAAIRRRVAGRGRPRVLLTVMRQPQRLANVMTAGRGTFLHEMIEVAGGINVFGEVEMAYPQVTGESILAARPEVIVELFPEIEVTPELAEVLRGQWRELGPLPAVAKRRIHFLSDDHSLIPSPRIVSVIEKMVKILHPDTIDAE